MLYFGPTIVLHVFISYLLGYLYKTLSHPAPRCYRVLPLFLVGSRSVIPSVPRLRTIYPLRIIRLLFHSFPLPYHL